MIASSILLGFINLVLCANENERKPHEPEPSDSNAHHVSNNHSNLGYGNSQANYQNYSGSILFNSGLDHDNQLTRPSAFVPYKRDVGLNQSVSLPIHSGSMVPNSMTVGKIPLEDQEITFGEPHEMTVGKIPLKDQEMSFGEPPSGYQGLPSKASIENLEPTSNNQSPTKRKRRGIISWKIHGLNALLKGINGYYTQLGKILQTKNNTRTSVNQSEFSDLVRAEIAERKKGTQGDADKDSGQEQDQKGSFFVGVNKKDIRLHGKAMNLSI